MAGEDINARIISIGEAINGTVHADEGTDGAIPTFNIPEGFDVFFRAIIRYRGPFSGGHETGALWLYNPATFEFALRGGEEYNYTR